ncbi:site-specific integrase [Edwardsiella tarda]|uniref:site-specific integrase n=1 Tax=Edwardsiella tarda TaxID=636 RepID=UPI00098F4528|nr:site-specific integrase [Edwardsiella tarda]
MTIRKIDSGEWLCDMRPNGRDGKRIRKKFATKGEALAYEHFVITQLSDKPWIGEKEDNRRLSEIIEIWYNLHGRTLTSSSRLLAKLKAICNGMGNPIASRITAADFSKYREKRLAGEIEDIHGRKTSVKPRTVNLEQGNLSAVFGTLKKLGQWDHANPITGIPRYKIDESELTFLYPNEIKRLLDVCSESRIPYLSIMVKLCLSTGARWGEIESLKGSQVTPYRITFIKTKGKKNRTVPISKELYDEIPKKRGQLFSECRKSLERALKRSGIELPEGQCSHVLRHTFASQFMMSGGSIIVLRDILGHADIKQTMVYAHFAPSHLEDAVTKNPLAILQRGEADTIHKVSTQQSNSYQQISTTINHDDDI